MFCIKCGNEIKCEMKFCPKCGAELPIIEQKDNDNSVPIDTTPVNSAPINIKADGMDEKIFNPIKLLPLVIIIVLIALAAVFLAKFGKGTSKNKVTDLAELINCTEDQVAEAFGCDVNELGMYPNEDNINVTCIDGKAYVVMLNANHKGDSKYTIKGISVGKTLDEEADLLSSFKQDYTYDVADGIRYVYTENATGYLLMLDTDATGTIIAASYSWDTSTVDDVSEEPQEEVSLEEKEEIEEVQEIDEYALPDYCVEAYGPDGMITHYENEQSGYIFGISDFSSDVIYNDENYKELLFKLSKLSNYSEIEVVIFEEDEEHTNLDDYLEMYINDNYSDFSADSNLLILSEFKCEDGGIYYNVSASTAIYDIFPEDEFNRMVDEVGKKDSVSIGFADIFIKAFEDKTTEVGYSSSGEEIRLTEEERYLEDTEEGISEYSNDDICNMCSKHYLSVYGEEPPYAVVDHEEGNKVTVQLCEAVDEDGYGFMSWAFYTIDRNTLSGYNDVSGEEIDLTPFAQ